MARVQQNAKKSKSKIQKKEEPKKPLSRKELIQVNTKREPTKNEIMFYRIGMSVITITLIVLAIVLVIQYSKTDTAVNPYEDNLSITITELTYITAQDEYGVYGDFTQFNGNDDYADLRTVLNSNDMVYIYFYRSSAIDPDIQAAIESVQNLDTMAFLFFDLDNDVNANVFTTAAISHLNLDSTKDNQLVIFDINAQTFQTETRVVDIVNEINSL